MKLSYRNNLEQKQVLSQTQIQSLNILSMDNVELNDLLQTEYLENPMLEYKGNSQNYLESIEFSHWYDNQQEEQRELNSVEQNKPYKQTAHNELLVYTENPLETYILNQLNEKNFTKKQWHMLPFMISCLDHNGYFKLSFKEVAHLTNGTISDATYCFNQLRQVEPSGIFSSGLKDCLLWQLKENGELDDIMRNILEEHLEDIAEGKLSNISRNMNLSTSQVRQYIARIAKLNPRPLAGFHFGITEFIVPDIIFTYKDNQWEISLNDTWIGDYHFNDYYIKMMKQANDKQLYTYFEQKLERVRFLMNSIEQRRTTMLQIAQAILEWQKKFFEGTAPIKPMTMVDIANHIHMHPSTISRGIKGKYLQHPTGTVLIKSLFSAPISSKSSNHAHTSTENITQNQVKKILKEIIATENKIKPYSDQKLSTLLAERNISISRRTVAKYREELGIRGTFERKIDG
ncbi:MAG: RNA polymerase factor sigma-54 [Firmicutes bacterium]|uniref:RNA polymerase factor sigma-54 n=1 Tax=Candidatus Scybalomonas excrementavium TaxID=2840943 RepID=A0A9D9N7D3_9FIRM|nr:RNA polymerase factor sigma-54 [Candidatus Scybalomonas excrementavium]